MVRSLASLDSSRRWSTRPESPRRRPPGDKARHQPPQFSRPSAKTQRLTHSKQSNDQGEQDQVLGGGNRRVPSQPKKREGCIHGDRDADDGPNRASEPPHPAPAQTDPRNRSEGDENNGGGAKVRKPWPVDPDRRHPAIQSPGDGATQNRQDPQAESPTRYTASSPGRHDV